MILTALHLVLRGIRTAFEEDLTDISSRARTRRATGNPRRATEPDRRPSGSSVPHHRAPPTYGPPRTNSGNTPRLPGHNRTQRPREVHTRLPPAGRNVQCVAATIRRPAVGPSPPSTPQPIQPQTQHHRPSHELQAPVTTYIFLDKQPSPGGGA
jgi:hypothetical protein